MLRNYFKTAWRSLVSNKAYSVINIIGLSTGMAVALLIGLWVYYQFSYDRFLPGYEHVYQVRYKTTYNGETGSSASVAYPLATVLKKDIPGIKYVAQTDWFSSHGLMVGDKKLYLRGVMADTSFLQLFQYPLIKGQAGEVLREMNSIVLTESLARSLFGDEDPINKTIRIDNRQYLKVTGIVKDIPANSTFQFNYIVPIKYYLKTEAWGMGWGNNTLQTFVGLQPGVSYAQVEPQLKTLLKQYSQAEYNSVKAEVHMQPVKDWHLYDRFTNGVASGGLIDYVNMFSLIAILILLIACINFMNLATARSAKRAKEVGIRKTLGSMRANLVWQFLVESIVLTTLAFLFAFVMVQLVLPAFNAWTGTFIHIPYDSSIFWMVMIGYILLTGLLAGSKPAFYLSSFKPIKVLKGSIIAGKAAALPRKILVVLQFTCSIALIISTIIIYQQVNYAINRPTGYDANRLMMTDVSPDINKNYKALKNELLQNQVVTSVTKSSSPVTGVWVTNDIDEWPGKQPGETLEMGTIAVSDADYFQTMGMQVIDGRNFTGELAVDTLSAVLNEAAVKRMRLQSPLNQVISWADRKQRIRIIGVVKDAVMVSPFDQYKPTMFIYDPNWANVVTYRLSSTIPTQQAITKLGQIFSKYNPSYPYLYHFVNEAYADKFTLEKLIGKLAGLFAILAIVISCLGLFGLAAYTAEQRTKEIGIRKVLGAGISQVWMLLSKDFIVLVLISCIIAAPIAYYFLQNWLHNYTYRVPVGAGAFLAAGIAGMMITVITISFQAIKAALANPVKSLRTE